MTDRRAHVVGLGLIGASVSLALRDAGWMVSGNDIEPEVEVSAVREGVIEQVGPHASTRFVVVATPAGVVAQVLRSLFVTLSDRDVIFTDVAGVKRDIVESIDDPRFLGGHPMAGSELRGLRGARADLFSGCTWILTPTEATSADLYTRLHGILRELEASVVAVSAIDHDRLVALASHVPHVLAGTLMNQAAEAAQEDAVLLQLAAGGFRDMTRIAAGDPTIWPDILIQNREAISEGLLAIEHRLASTRAALAAGDRGRIEASLQTASVARRLLPGRALASDQMTYLRVPMPDRPGVLATITMIASELLVNIYDIEIAHGIEGERGTLLLTVDLAQADVFQEALVRASFVVGREQ